RLRQSEVAQSVRRRLPHVAVLVTAAVLALVALAYLLRPSLPSPKLLRTIQLPTIICGSSRSWSPMALGFTFQREQILLRLLPLFQPPAGRLCLSRCPSKVRPSSIFHRMGLISFWYPHPFGLRPMQIRGCWRKRRASLAVWET